MHMHWYNSTRGQIINENIKCIMTQFPFSYVVVILHQHVAHVRLTWHMHVYLSLYTEYGFFTELASLLCKQYIKASNIKIKY